MDKDNIFQALDAFLSKNFNPYLSGYFNKSEYSLNKIKCFHSEAWAVGGRTGGSCWNNGANRDVEQEDSKPIELLENFLEDFYPHLSLAQYKGLTDLIVTESWCDSEYYGNYTYYECSYIEFKAIAEYLVNMKESHFTI